VASGSAAAPRPVLSDDSFVRPYAARALLDGVEVARRRRVVFRMGRAPVGSGSSAYVRAFERTVNPYGPRIWPELKVPLDPPRRSCGSPANPATSVWLADCSARRASRSATIIMPGDGDNPYEGVLDLRLEPPGRPAVNAPVRVRAGQEIVVRCWRPRGAPVIHLLVALDPRHARHGPEEQPGTSTGPGRTPRGPSRRSWRRTRPARAAGHRGLADILGLSGTSSGSRTPARLAFLHLLTLDPDYVLE